MARIIISTGHWLEQVKGKPLLEEKPRQILATSPGFTVDFRDINSTNPAVLSALGGSQLHTGQTAGEAMLATTLIPRSDSEQERKRQETSIVGFLKRKATKKSIGERHIIKRGLKSNYIKEAVTGGNLTRVNYIKTIGLPTSVLAAIASADQPTKFKTFKGDPLDFPAGEFLRWFYNEVTRQAGFFSDAEKIDKDPKEKCNFCSGLCDREGICEDCGRKSVIRRGDPLLLDRLEYANDEELSEEAWFTVISRKRPDSEYPEDPEDRFIRQIDASSHKIFSALSDPDRHILELRYVKGFTSKEVSHQIGSKPARVDRRVCRIKSRLKKNINS